jgi:hypothetical protein
MIYVLSVIAGMVAAVAGWFVTGVVALWVAGWLGMSDFEGGRGMFAFLGVGPIGGLICMVAAVWIVLRVGKGRTTLGHALARLAAVLGTIALVVAAAIWIRLYTLDTYTDSAPPSLELELRIAADLAAPDPSSVRVELHTDKNIGTGWLDDQWLAADGGSKVIAAGVPLAFKTTARLLVLSLPGQPTRIFRLPLSRDPSSTASFGAWRRADHIAVAGEDQPRAAPQDDPVELRYRVRRAGED